MRTPAPRSRSGFTLLELLLVIAVMAILGTIILGGANYVTRVAAAKRVQTTAATLTTALYRYRNEYSEWPKGNSTKTKGTLTFKENNGEVFNMLRAENKAANENGIPFFDETSVFTVDEEDGEQVLVRYADKPGGPVCYLSRDKKVIRYYIVTINLDNDTASVSYNSSELNDGD